MSEELARRFMARFRGFSDAHGRYHLDAETQPNEKGKLESPDNQRVTWKRLPGSRVTLDLWQRHLKGEFSLGIVPTDRDGQSYFGAIDVDVYKGLDHEVIAKKIIAAGLPLIVTRSKSGGAHLYLFTNGPVPTSLLRTKLREWANYLGYDEKTEIFPKQDGITDDASVGNWINMPYCGEFSSRYGYKGIEGLDAVGYLAYADEMAVSLEQLVAIKLPERETEKTESAPEPQRKTRNTSKGDVGKTLWQLGPPCLQALRKIGVEEGGRDNALYSYSVLLKRAYDDWEAKVHLINETVLQPPFSRQEVDQKIKAWRKNTKSYKCSDVPLVEFCDKEACLRRKFGIAGGRDSIGLDLGDLTIMMTEPRVYIWIINGVRVEFSSTQFQDQQRFRHHVFDHIWEYPQGMKQHDWEAFISGASKAAHKEEMPVETSRSGKYMQPLRDFCSRVPANAEEEIIDGRTWHDPDGFTYFLATKFMEYLRGRRMSNDEPFEVFLRIREAIPQTKFGIKTLKGVEVHYWAVPSFPEQTEAFEVHRSPPEDAM